jgi:mRNA-degrading endonuclease RelE of RelBE toxin-antitoxin system
MIDWKFTPSFKRAFKKLDKPIKKIVEKGLEQIKSHPEIGRQKLGDLSDVFVHKVKYKSQQLLIAYVYDDSTGQFIAVGFHENFYRDLKKK